MTLAIKRCISVPLERLAPLLQRANHLGADMDSNDVVALAVNATSQRVVAHATDRTFARFRADPM
jgi:hypothetical protein